MNNILLRRPGGCLNGSAVLLTLSLLLCGGTAWGAGDVLWRSGPNLYISLTGQDQLKRTATPPNQHPAQLDAQQLSQALESIQVWSAGGLFGKKEMKKLFSLQQARLLGQYISVGLAKADAGQDLVFVLARAEKKYYVMQDTGYTGGRVFYLDDKLHVIIGDYDATGDRFKERAQKSHGVTDVKQYFRHGRRAKASNFKGVVVSNAGLSVYKTASRTRRDWLVIDLEQAAAVYLAEQRAQQSPIAESPLAGPELERLARERRRMRLEMARMRQALRASDGGARRPIEERLGALDELKAKGLITDSEYQDRRAAILEEI